MNNEDLSYFEYWLTKDRWQLCTAIRLMVQYYKYNKTWKLYEDEDVAVSKYHDDMLNKLTSARGTNVFKNYLYETKIQSKEGVEYINKLNIYETIIDPKEFILWLLINNYKVPYEFESYVGGYDPEPILNQRQQDTIDKESCKRIAQTLWDIYPDMTIEDIVNHRAILVYGSGKLHENMLRRWVSQVDPREKKRGRKKLSQ